MWLKFFVASATAELYDATRIQILLISRALKDTAKFSSRYAAKDFYFLVYWWL
jgi:hypothetical protein